MSYGVEETIDMNFNIAPYHIIVSVSSKGQGKEDMDGWVD